MKNKKLLLIIVPVILVLIGAIIIGIILNKNNDEVLKPPIEEFNGIKYTPIDFKESDVKSAIVSQPFGIDIRVTEQSDLSVLVTCIDKVRENNKHYLSGVLQSPNEYKIEFTLTDGTVKNYAYKTYPASVEPTPFKEFFQLESVIKQNNPVFSIDSSDISKLVIKYTNRADKSIMHEYEITEKTAIAEILVIGQENALINKESPHTSCVLEFYNNDTNPKCVSTICINEKTHKLDYLCDKYPEFKQVVETAKKYKFE